MSGDSHDRFHELLARRLDAPLEAPDDAALDGHLAGCAACRVVERDYAAQRQQLRLLSRIEAPRDLWARTRTAIDREITRDGPRPRLAPSPRLGRSGTERQLRLAVGSLVGVLVVLMVAGGPLLQGTPTPTSAATPFPIAPQSVAFVDVAGGQATLYRTDVAQACPPTHVDCQSGLVSRPVAHFVAGLEAREMALGGNGQVFIASRDALGGEVFAIVDLARNSGPPATPSPTPEATTAIEPSGAPTVSPDLAATVDPKATPVSATETPSGSASSSPDDLLTTEARPILSDVRGTGAPAAWSPDGTILAFSAIPADHSQGSDIYTWRPGEDVASPLTADHRSVFASWAGARIVMSRLVLPDPGDPDAVLTAETVVIDPGTAEERAVVLADSWLPSVDPSRRWVIYWTGRLAAKEGVVVPLAGRLLVADWASIDPWAAHDAAATPEPISSDGTPTGSGPSSTPKTTPTATPEDTADGTPTATPEATTAAGPTPTNEGTAAGSPDAASDGPASNRPASGATPTVPDRPDAVSGDIIDWVVRWAADSDAFGIWSASRPDGSGSGSLTIRSAPSVKSPVGDTLLGPIPARRSFALGADRVVWVTPLPSGDGELWMATWGIGGNGSLRIRNLDSAQAVPAF